MPSPAQILCHRNFQYEDGTHGEKLFVVLCAAEGGRPCLALKTTSQVKRYAGSTDGCNAGKRVFFLPQGREPCFSLATYIQLPQVFEFSAKDLIEGSIAQDIYIGESRLSDSCFQNLKNCLRKFRDDISDRHWAMIF